ncbi:hypothetical protein CEXT_497941 [Caerostris extrusa]|uniref:Uncharacterized protein n=1 Tax=Caerostris extrusa TaxID=172846 RepID=A0AAV4TG51_CAEEX|nr:hypothetical protein CEXT_497941 [Caerostris extrusa]
MSVMYAKERETKIRKGGKGKKIRKDDTTEAFDGLMSKTILPCGWCGTISRGFNASESFNDRCKKKNQTPKNVGDVCGSDEIKIRKRRKRKKIRKDDTTEAFDGLMSKSHPPVWMCVDPLEASMPANLLTTDARVFFKTAQWGVEGSGIYSGTDFMRVVWGSAHFIPQIHAPFTSGPPTSILWDVINSAELFNDMEALCCPLAFNSWW